MIFLIIKNEMKFNQFSREYSIYDGENRIKNNYNKLNSELFKVCNNNIINDYLVY